MRLTSDILVPHFLRNIFLSRRRRRRDETMTHRDALISFFFFSFTRVARLSLISRTVNGRRLSRRGWREIITFNPPLRTMIDAPAFIGSCKLTIRANRVPSAMTIIDDNSFAIDTLCDIISKFLYIEEKCHFNFNSIFIDFREIDTHHRSSLCKIAHCTSEYYTCYVIIGIYVTIQLMSD